jgi:signal transduction histidine kinase
MAGSLSVPERVNFKYKMDDDGWQDAGTRRQAFFTGLSPGHHRFQVIASNGYGVWNETGASVDISRPPSFQESIWFKLLWAGAGSLAIGAVFFLRMRQAIFKTQLRMSERLVERERIARDLHDTLLQGFQGVLLRFQTIAKRLNGDQTVQREMEDTIQRADTVLSDARDKVWQLRATSRTYDDLAGFLTAAAADLSSQWRANFSLHVIGTPRPLITGAFDEICAIAQEALANAFQHSEAKEIEVELHFNQSEFRVRICDNGLGLPPNARERNEKTKHWGLLGMQERAKKLSAQLAVLGQEGGTEVQLTVPASVCYRPEVSKWKWYLGGESL